MGVYSNMALAEAAKLSNVPSSAAQFMIESYRSDLSLFNAVIECDFASALGEAGIIAFTEADQQESNKVRKEGILNKIKVAIKKAIDFISKKIQEFKDALSALADKDKSLYLKFDKVITSEAIKDCDIKSDFPDLKKIQNNGLKAASALNVIADLAKIDSATSIDEITKIDEIQKSKVEKAINTISGEDAINSLINTDDVPVVEKIDLNELKSTIKTGYKNTQKQFEVTCSTVKRELELTQKDIEKSLKDEKDELAVAKLNAKASCVSRTINFYTKYTAYVSVANKKFIKLYRKVYSLLGVYCVKKQNGTANTEEAKTEAFAIGEFSDAVVEAAFEI